MERYEFEKRLREVETTPSENELKTHIQANRRDFDEDLAVCVGELAELTLELTRHQRGKMHMSDLIQELSHVQWAVWSLQAMFGVDDETLLRAIQASFR